jgi:hypothetical protein
MPKHSARDAWIAFKWITASGAVGPDWRRAGGAMLNLLRLTRAPKPHTRIPEPWRRHRYAWVLRYAHLLKEG